MDAYTGFAEVYDLFMDGVPYREWAERIVVLCGGRVIADGSRNEIFGNRRVLELTGIRPPEIFDMGKVLNTGAFCYTIQEFRQQFGCGCL